MGQRLAAVVMAIGVTVASAGTAASGSGWDPVIQTVLRMFEEHANQTIDGFLASLRPPPLAPAERAQVLAGLPKAQVHASRKQMEKIAAADRVLDYNARQGSISIRPISVDLLFVGLYDRTVVLASTQSLELLRAEEFAALVSHELGHDYHWNEYVTALEHHDFARVRELELWSDGIAVLTLMQVGIDPERLVSAVERQTHYNEVRDAVFRAMTGADVQTTARRYVRLEQRTAFIRAVAHLRWAGETRSE